MEPAEMASFTPASSVAQTEAQNTCKKIGHTSTQSPIPFPNVERDPPPSPALKSHEPSMCAPSVSEISTRLESLGYHSFPTLTPHHQSITVQYAKRRRLESTSLQCASEYGEAGDEAVSRIHRQPPDDTHEDFLDNSDFQTLLGQEYPKEIPEESGSESPEDEWDDESEPDNSERLTFTYATHGPSRIDSPEE